MNNLQFKALFDANPKNLQYKRRIVDYFIANGPDTLNVLAKELDISVPTVNKFVSELCDTGVLKCYGKLETSGGRHPFLYGLSSENCFFLGVDFEMDKIHMAVMDLCGERVAEKMDQSFVFENTPECLQSIIDSINGYLDEVPMGRDRIVAIGVNIFGRLNPMTGYTFTYFNFDELPLSKKFTDQIGISTFVDNDARACAFGEYMASFRDLGHNMLFVNVAWGLGLGIVIEGAPYAGKSGFSGEFGHIHAYDNEIICPCGKKGCLETEASGSAMHRKFVERIKRGDNSLLLQRLGYTPETVDKVTLGDLVEATRMEDITCIEILEEVGDHLGMHIAGLINLFNPDVVVVGGALSQTGDYLMQPLRSAIRKYSLNMVNQDTALKISVLQDFAGVTGACMFARKKIVESLVK